MKLKSTKLFSRQQLMDLGSRFSTNFEHPVIRFRGGKTLCLSVILFLAIPTALVKAQVTPDESLSTNVEEQGENELNINGGEREGNNLFHSFEEFSIPEGIEAVFENASDIENIFTRITGESASVINGILRTQGGANFFLVNPNGIVFGENAQLDVGGSFIATTANSVQFEDGAEFIADDAQQESILTVSVPIGLQFEGNNGAITVNGSGSSIVSDSIFSPIDLGNTESGLSVTSGKTLALIGGDITLDGGIIRNNGGQIELSSVDSGFAKFQETENGLIFDYGNVNGFQDIAIEEQTLIDVSGNGAKGISLTGSNIAVSNGSFVLVQNQGNTNSGTLNINAFESLNLSGTSPDGEVASSIRSESLNIGQASDINISTRKLQVSDQGSIQAGTYGKASSGDITINATDSVQLTLSSINDTTFAEGDAGNIQISTPQLKAIDGAFITSSTTRVGDGGNVNVDANSIELIGTSTGRQSNISAVSFGGSGNAGNVTVNSSQLKLIDGGLISTSSVADGDAGNLTVNASEAIEVSGQKAPYQSTISSSVVFLISQDNQKIPTGNAGKVNISTPRLDVNSGGEVTVKNEGSGNAGTLSIDAEDINLDSTGSITAASASGNGGNIHLNTDNLQINEGSQITAEAGNNGDGGNININTNTLIAKKKTAK
jgi:filamentous hemagglutinin family protein